MKVSVVIATYNRAAMVKQAVEAALAQSRAPDEIVVMDDASTDDTAAVLSALAAAHPVLRVFRRETNSGGVASWNEAIGRASGDVLAFCCDDDRFLRDHLEISLAYLDQHPDVGLVHSGFVDVVETPGCDSSEPRALRSNNVMLIGRDDLLAYMTRYYDWPFHYSTIVVRREAWERIGEFDSGYALADTDWFVRASEKTLTALLPRHGVLNRRHPGNWSNRLGSARMQREIFEIVERAMDRLWHGRPLGRALWKTIWRANVRLRLALTLFARMRSGHAEAAQAAWHGILQDTGRHTPVWMEQRGASIIERVTRGRQGGVVDARSSVSPL